MEDARSLDELWRSHNPRWGTVREVVVREPYAAVLDDLNSDHREIELRVYERTSAGWRFVFHQDDVSGVGGTVDQVGGWSIGFHHDSPGTFCHLGRADPGSTVRVSFGELEAELVTGSDGWWLWAMPMGPEEAGRVFSPHPTRSYLHPELRVEQVD